MRASSGVHCNWFAEFKKGVTSFLVLMRELRYFL